ncbi:MAG: proline--tRNA ligase [Polyangiaceae bacterium]|nr:proline--tRNA ligase [Polyangiaceae bacterium]
MRYSKALIPTLKEAPSDAISISHILLMRAGYIRRIGAGIYSFLPLGLKALRKIEEVVRGEMNQAGSQELLLPAILPAELFKESGRWDKFGDTLFRLKDRKGGDYHLGPTHEETITDLARREIHSYRELPQNWYQVQNKYRDEPRPRGGLLRGREFLMKDAYSFDASEEEALSSYESMRLAYRRIFDRLGFRYRMVGADSGAMGGSKSAEFQVLVQSGEDFIAACDSCEYAENIEVAAAPRPSTSDATASDATAPDAQTPEAVEEIATPGRGSIEAVSKFLKTEPAKFLKSLIYTAGEELVMVVVRGDHEVNEIRLARELGVDEVHLANGKAVKEATGSPIGFIGPVGYKGRILIDHDAAALSEGICGALKNDYHLAHVVPGRDFQAEAASLRLVTAGDACPKCGKGLSIYRGIEAGHIFVLGTHYSEKMNAVYLDEAGEKRPLVMGCYGIGISRLVASLVEQHHDDSGIVWPVAAAPYPVHITQMGTSDAVVAAVAKLERELEELGIEALIDDRDLRPGVKFKDADLIGLPWRITIGERSLKEGQVELKPRTEPNPKAAQAIPLDGAARHLAELIAAATNLSSLAKTN